MRGEKIGKTHETMLESPFLGLLSKQPREHGGRGLRDSQEKHVAEKRRMNGDNGNGHHHKRLPPGLLPATNHLCV